MVKYKVLCERCHKEYLIDIADVMISYMALNPKENKLARHCSHCNYAQIYHIFQIEIEPDEFTSEW